MENPGYPRTAQVLRNNGVRTVFVPVDGDGMTLDALQAGGAQLRMSRPATSPIGRNDAHCPAHGTAALGGAAPGRYVVEDDYDSEFRYDTRPFHRCRGWTRRGG